MNLTTNKKYIISTVITILCILFIIFQFEWSVILLSLLGDVAFYLLPVTILASIIIYLISFKQKDYQKFNTVASVLSVFYILGFTDFCVWFFKVPLTFYFLITLLFVVILYKKKDIRYQVIIPFLSLIAFVVFYINYYLELIG